MELKLKSVVENISIVSQSLANGANELSTAASQIASGSNEQAASTEEISASMEEMASNINQNSENANQAEKISVKAAIGIEEGNKSFDITLNAMREIAEKISVIGYIAEKTDILAINAAIEAARAGEHGKGFAVVASEIRKLAENSQAAANVINELVKKSVTVAEKSGKLLTEITPEVQKTAVLVQEISVASNEQNSGSNQINNAIQELTKVIQQNTSAADEMAMNSRNISLQAEQLTDAVSFFKIGKTLIPLFEEKQKIKTSNKNTSQNYKSSTSEKGINLNLDRHNSDDDFENF